VVRYLAETTYKASQADDKSHLRWLHRYLNGVELGCIDRDRLDAITQARKAEGGSNATVNRTLEVVRAILRKAALEWNWSDKAPSVRMTPRAHATRALAKTGGSGSIAGAVAATSSRDGEV
jgi:hypothetical protein